MAFPIGWQRVCPLTIQHGKVAAGNLADFPIYISASQLPAEMVTLGGANAAQADGGDIRFSSDPSGLNQLPCEIVLWNQNAVPANATAEIWVKMPYVSGIYDTPVYVWYHAVTAQTQPAAGASFGSQAVWDAFSQFVWHGGDGVTLGLSSSTVNANTLTNNGAVAAVAGKLGGAGNFSGANYLSNVGPVGTPNSGAITISVWVYLTNNLTTSRSALIATVAGGAATSTALIGFDFNTQKVYTFLISGTPETNGALPLNTWTHIAMVFAPPSVYMFINGMLDNVSTPGAFVFGASEIRIGAWAGPSQFWLGKIDEVRISNTMRSPGWIASGYANQNNPGTFVVVGAPYSPGPYA